MLLKPLTLATAGLAAAAQAFLLPPKISPAGIDVVSALREIPKADSVTVSKTLYVPCAGCVVQTKHKHPSANAATDKSLYLELRFDIQKKLEQDRLMVNGFELFPSTEAFEHVLRGAIVEAQADHGFQVTSRLDHTSLGYSLTVNTEAQEDGLALLLLDFQIIQVGHAFVNGIPHVQIKLVNDMTTGAMAIGSVETTESQTLLANPMDKQEECTTFMCEWVAIMKDSMSKVGKPCHGKKMGASTKGSRPQRPHHNHHHSKHPKGDFDGRHHSWGQLFKNIAAHILLPVAIGIVAGVSVSLIGMAVGTLIVSVWRVFFRRPSHRRTRSHSRAHSHNKAPKQEIAAADGEEKSSLIEHQDPPPSYEEEDAKDVPV